jgi:hypothetical protein
MVPVDEHGHPLGGEQDEQGEGSVFETQEARRSVPLAALVGADTVEEWLALAGDARRVEIPVVQEDCCKLVLTRDVDGLEVWSAPCTLGAAARSKGSCLSQGLDQEQNWEEGYELRLSVRPTVATGKVVMGPAANSRQLRIGFASVEGKEMVLLVRLCKQQAGRNEAVEELKDALQTDRYKELMQRGLAEVPITCVVG